MANIADSYQIATCLLEIYLCETFTGVKQFFRDLLVYLGNSRKLHEPLLTLATAHPSNKLIPATKAKALIGLELLQEWTKQG